MNTTTTAPAAIETTAMTVLVVAYRHTDSICLFLCLILMTLYTDSEELLLNRFRATAAKGSKHPAEEFPDSSQRLPLTVCGAGGQNSMRVHDCM